MTHTLQAIRGFAHTHDDEPAFHAAFFVLVALSAFLFNLGVFAVLVLLHMLLDVVKYRDFHGFTWARTFKAMLRENLIDITLVCLGLSFAVYLHHSLSHIAALKGLALAELTLIRTAALFGAKLKILCDVLGVFLYLEHYMAIRHPRIARPFSGLEKVCAVSIAICLILLCAAMAILGIDSGSLAKILMHELIPGLL